MSAIHANDTLIEDCTFGTGHGASIGSITTAYLKNITVRRTSFTGSVQALRIKSHPGATGFLRDVSYSDISMKNVNTSILLTMEYPDPQPGAKTSLKISNITFGECAQDMSPTSPFVSDDTVALPSHVTLGRVAQ